MVAPRISHAVDFRQCADALALEAPRMVPYVAAATLTALAGDSRTRVQKRMPEVFDGVTDFTLRGVFTKGATKFRLEAEVYFPDSGEASGKAKREFIRPGAKGAGRRSQKRTEFLLSRLGALPAGWVTTPGKGAALDANGNLAGSVYRQIISVLQIRYNKLKPVSVRNQKAAKRLSVPALFFVVTPGPNAMSPRGGWLPPGVWKHLPGGKITQILKFVRKASYKPRLDIDLVVRQAVAFNLERRWRENFSMVRDRFAAKGGR